MNSVPDKVAKFETLVRVLNWENGLFAAMLALGYALSATRALSTASAISRGLVAALAVACGALLLTMTRYRLNTDSHDDITSHYREELLRQAKVRRRSIYFVAPLVASLLVNARVSQSLFSLGLAALILAGQWVNAFLSRTWLREARTLEDGTRAV